MKNYVLENGVELTEEEMFKIVAHYDGEKLLPYILENYKYNEKFSKKIASEALYRIKEFYSTDEEIESFLANVIDETITILLDELDSGECEEENYFLDEEDLDKE